MSLTDYFTILFSAISMMLLSLYIGHEGGYEKGYNDGRADASNEVKKKTLIEYTNGKREYVNTKSLKDYKNYKIVDQTIQK